MLNDILVNFPRDCRVVIGIDGLSRSGKTTFVKELRETNTERDIIVIHLDDVIEARKARYHTGHEQWYEYYGLQWNVAYLRDHLFNKVKNEPTVTLRQYDEQTDTHSFEQRSISRDAVVLIEGVFLQRKEWRDAFDYVIYLDCPRSVRFSRESKETQKQVQKFTERYWKAEDFYGREVSPKTKADLVISR